MYTPSFVEWLLALHFGQMVAAFDSRLSLTTGRNTRLITISAPHSLGTWPLCDRENWDHLDWNRLSTHCWLEQTFEFEPPLATSVACNSVTYLLNGTPTQSTNVMTAVKSLLITDIQADPEYSSLLEQYVLQMIPAGGTTTEGDCHTWGFENPSNVAQSCEIFAGNVHLLYSPPERSIWRDMCAEMPSLTITDYGNAQHIPQTVLDGVTLFKDRVYISVDKIYAWTTVWGSSSVDPTNYTTSWECSVEPLGTTILGTIIELKSHEVSTIRIPYTDRFYPFNYADLIDPVPRSAWLGRNLAAMSRPYIFPPPHDFPKPEAAYANDTMIPPPYQPWLAMPSIISNIDPLWKSCAGYVAGWKDPPRAMAPTNSVEAPTITAIQGYSNVQTELEFTNGKAMPGPSPPMTATATPGRFRRNWAISRATMMLKATASTISIHKEAATLLPLTRSPTPTQVPFRPITPVANLTKTTDQEKRMMTTTKPTALPETRPTTNIASTATLALARLRHAQI